MISDGECYYWFYGLDFIAIIIIWVWACAVMLKVLVLWEKTIKVCRYSLKICKRKIVKMFNFNSKEMLEYDMKSMPLKMYKMYYDTFIYSFSIFRPKCMMSFNCRTYLVVGILWLFSMLFRAWCSMKYLWVVTLQWYFHCTYCSGFLRQEVQWV